MNVGGTSVIVFCVPSVGKKKTRTIEKKKVKEKC